MVGRFDSDSPAEHIAIGAAVDNPAVADSLVGAADNLASEYSRPAL